MFQVSLFNIRMLLIYIPWINESINVRIESYWRSNTFFYLYFSRNWKEVTSVKMFLQVISIVFLFMIRLPFPSHLSKIQVIPHGCGNEVVTLMLKFERLDFIYWKVLPDLDFVGNCIRNGFVPNIVQFGVSIPRPY